MKKISYICGSESIFLFALYAMSRRINNNAGLVMVGNVMPQNAYNNLYVALVFMSSTYATR